MENPDGRRRRGDASRTVVLTRAADLASVEGLDQLSLGRIAEAAAVSKSGIATLFGNKERLQLATVATARERFLATVVEPARTHARGLDRVVALLANWIAYSRDRVFPGGCFFAGASTDFDSKPGPVRDALSRALDDWHDYLAHSLKQAAERGELAAGTDGAQLAFEFTALLDAANGRSVMTGSDAPYDRAIAGLVFRLRASGAPVDALAALDAAPARPAPPHPSG
ncbi:TetR/AcrR family transcriptional regulator [Leifsonia poae]|uniref:TetR/AcrR family transcriptional regulator n=1 Tax=Leifsonia poae TaxID=110933 RepID=UPI001CBD8AB0|nr:TetR/AcrR family transcriptional regulator [Leifsonia poae]